jgi:hypothetical protein
VAVPSRVTGSLQQKPHEKRHVGRDEAKQGDPEYQIVVCHVAERVRPIGTVRLATTGAVCLVIAGHLFVNPRLTAGRNPLRRRGAWGLECATSSRVALRVRLLLFLGMAPIYPDRLGNRRRQPDGDDGDDGEH